MTMVCTLQVGVYSVDYHNIVLGSTKDLNRNCVGRWPMYLTAGVYGARKVLPTGLGGSFHHHLPRAPKIPKCLDEYFQINFKILGSFPVL